MSNISLEGSIRTCKIDTSWADKIQSDRFLNPNQMVCPVWNNVDSAGRFSSPNAFMSKTAGCNTAADRVDVENSLRPQYIEYVNLDAAGIQGGLDCGKRNFSQDNICNQNTMDAIHEQTGQFGLQTDFSQNIMPNCVSCRDSRGSQEQNMRAMQFAKQANRVRTNKKSSGFFW